MAIDPFLRAGSVALAKHRGLLRACADDVGAVLRRLAHLRDLFPVFADAESVALTNVCWSLSARCQASARSRSYALRARACGSGVELL